jgi:SAM-dependent methyltransferase
VERKLRGLFMGGTLKRYQAALAPASPLRDVPVRIVGDASADPTETIEHYDAFAFWCGERIVKRSQRLAILDVGSKKMLNMAHATQHDVTALVLRDCGDSISPVKYVLHDVSDPLPFPDASFDVFTSTVSLPLIGLARYGDKLNPNCLPNLVAELRRVVKPDGELLVSMCLGRNILNFNNGWFFDLPKIEQIFEGWKLKDFLVDNWSSPRRSFAGVKPRFTRDVDVSATATGDYRVIFLQFLRQTAGR